MTSPLQMVTRRALDTSIPPSTHGLSGWILASVFATTSTPGLLAQSTPGTVVSQSMISSTSGGLSVPLVDGDLFGAAVTSVGDFNGDGINDVMVGVPNDDTGGTDRGAVLLLLLKANGSVANQRKIAFGAGGFGGAIDNLDHFGDSIANIGDIDGNGVIDVAIGAPGDDDGAVNSGAVWIVKMKADGTVDSSSKISATQGGLPSGLTSTDGFGGAVTSLGDLDGDGSSDLAVGAPQSDASGGLHGEVWILFMQPGGTTVKSAVRLHGLSPSLGFSPGPVGFGSAVCGVGDIDLDGHVDLAVGAPFDDTGGPSNRGAIYLLSLAANGSVISHELVAQGTGGFTGTIAGQSRFGSSIAKIGDIDQDGFDDLVVGSPWSAGVQGGFWILFMNGSGNVAHQQEVSPLIGDLQGSFATSDFFGGALTNLGDTNGDGVDDLFVGAEGMDVGGVDRGAAFVIRLAGKWVNTGDGKPGVGGIPLLAGTGGLTAGSLVGIHLTGAAPNAMAILAIGTSKIDLPVYGGIFVPSPDFVIAGLPTDVGGNLSLGAPWPTGVPSDFTLYFQYWIADPSATFGYSASNGLSATTP